MHDTMNAPDYWQMDNFNWLVMFIRNYHWLNPASQYRPAPHHWFKRESVKQFSLFDLDLWPTTLTYNPRLAKVKVDPRAKIKVKGQTVQIGECPQTNRHTRRHMDATKRIISSAKRSIMKQKYILPQFSHDGTKPQQLKVHHFNH